LTEGVDQARFERRYGAPIAHFFEQELARGVELGVLDVTPERIRLTERGTFVSNQAMHLFV
jgi:coproporphyrinogen III oxidase-like Fe-S oxidoreductase